MDTSSLKQFLIDSNAAGFAGGDSKQWIKEADGSTTIPYKKGPWRSDDNYYGGEPYGGRIIVFYDEKPYWIMVYYGWVEEGSDHDALYKVLQNALMNMPEDNPYRGPASYTEGSLIYTNSWNGSIENYSGKEEISDGATVIYTATYMGGLVDQRR